MPTVIEEKNLEVPTDVLSSSASSSPNAASTLSVEPFPPASLGYKALLTGAVLVPFLATIGGIVLLWNTGWMGGLYLGLLVIGWTLTGMGITIGYHRMLSHHSFEAHPIAKVFWSTMGAMAVEGSPVTWTAVHRQHHQFSDLEGDPHSPHLHGRGWWNAIKGFWHSHTGWLFSGANQHAYLKRYVPDLLEDRWMMWMHRNYVWLVVLSLVLPMAIGGLVTWSLSGAALGLLWGGLVRVFVGHHITWSINSVCHVFGSHDYESRDESTNNVIFGVLAFGEGWHNNHHAFPTSARHGLKWWQFDMSWLVIRGMQAVGLVKNIRLPSAEQLESRKKQPRS